ncbi:hypothetical protein [Janthinobacterium sp. HLX7-2]|uniref:hypothetical protein n=1 Tax=Janthinobacterium sp. HLX7-2 TaxID=1259331 RepID=UPI003F244BE6
MNCLSLEMARVALDRHFGAGAGSVAAMRLRSPLMMSVTLELLQRGAHLGLADCLRMECTLVRHLD